MKLQCSICQEELIEPSKQPCVVKCGHIFHFECLLQWLQHKQTCPKCRKPATEASIVHPLYFDFLGEESASEDSQQQLPTISELSFKIRQVERDLEEKSKLAQCLSDKLSRSESESQKACEKVTRLEQKLVSKTGALEVLQREAVELRQEKERSKKLLDETKEKLRHLKYFETVMNGSTSEANDLFERLADQSGSANVRSLTALLNVLKQERDKSCKEASQKTSEVATLKQKLHSLEKRLQQMTADYRCAREEVKMQYANAKSTPCNPHVKRMLNEDSPFTPVVDKIAAKLLFENENYMPSSSTVFKPMAQSTQSSASSSMPAAKLAASAEDDVSARKRPTSTLRPSASSTTFGVLNLPAVSSVAGKSNPSSRTGQQPLAAKPICNVVCSAKEKLQVSDGFGAHNRLPPTLFRPQNSLLRKTTSANALQASKKLKMERLNSNLSGESSAVPTLSQFGFVKLNSNHCRQDHLGAESKKPQTVAKASVCSAEPEIIDLDSD